MSKQLKSFEGLFWVGLGVSAVLSSVYGFVLFTYEMFSLFGAASILVVPGTILIFGIVAKAIANR